MATSKDTPAPKEDEVSGEISPKIAQGATTSIGTPEENSELDPTLKMLNDQEKDLIAQKQQEFDDATAAPEGKSK